MKIAGMINTFEKVRSARLSIFEKVEGFDNR
jgi:hypothetical protein